MRNGRRKRKRLQSTQKAKALQEEEAKIAVRGEIQQLVVKHGKLMQTLKNSLTKERQKTVNFRKRLKYYTSTNKVYFDRWQWEARKRKEAELRELWLRTLSKYTSAKVPDALQETISTLHEIQPRLLRHPSGFSDDQPRYLGQGSFGVVKHQHYRDFNVAVKEFRINTLTKDVHNEACILSKLSHPNVPYLFGVCTKAEPLKLVMQLHGICTTGELKVHTFSPPTLLWVFKHPKFNNFSSATHSPQPAVFDTNR